MESSIKLERDSVGFIVLLFDVFSTIPLIKLISESSIILANELSIYILLDNEGTELLIIPDTVSTQSSVTTCSPPTLDQSLDAQYLGVKYLEANISPQHP